MSAACATPARQLPNGTALPPWEQPEPQHIRVKPAPLAQAAFYGIAGEFVRIVEPHSESDPAALLVQFLVASGIYLGRNAFHLVESSRHYTNLFAVVCGDSGKARKGTSWGRVRALFAQTDAMFSANCFPSGLSSGEGLIFHVRDAVSEIRFGKGGTEGRRVVVDDGVTDKRICIVESEFSRTLKVAGGDTNILSAVLRNAYDTGDLDNLTKNNHNKATGAHIGLIAHITKDEVIRLLTNTEAANGFGNRFLWVWAFRSKLLPFGGNLAADALDGVRQGLIDAEANMYPDMPGIEFSAEAKELWAERYEDLSAGKPGLTGALIARGEAHVLRLALIYAALERAKGKREISLAHLQAALAIWDYCEASARFIFGAALGDETADEILRYLKTVGVDGATRTDISKMFSRNKTSAEISRSLAVLQTHALAKPVMEKTGGAPAERWVYVAPVH